MQNTLNFNSRGLVSNKFSTSLLIERKCSIARITRPPAHPTAHSRSITKEITPTKKS